jgi:hypothetical protein
VFFTVMPKSDLPTSTEIHSQASIVFDINAPIHTQVWTNTLDNSSPASAVLSLPSTVNSPIFTVSWAGADSGTGIQDFVVRVADNGGPFADFQTNTTAISAVFNGQAGHSYSFYSIARDLVGNVEVSKSLAEATTFVVTDSTAPVLTLPSTVTVNATSITGAIVSYLVSATDETDGVVAVNCAPPTASTFPIGDTAVNCTVTDRAGNSAGGSFNMHVKGATEQLNELWLGVINDSRLPANAKTALVARIHRGLGAVRPVESKTAHTCLGCRSSTPERRSGPPLASYRRLRSCERQRCCRRVRQR